MSILSHLWVENGDKEDLAWWVKAGNVETRTDIIHSFSHPFCTPGLNLLSSPERQKLLTSPTLKSRQRHREGKLPIQGHTASTWQSQGSNPCL